ncbi:MAG TPA: hypothetical protein VMQ10_07420 [Spirochaetia bacterium]|nr:hypothetical protein [Spirochaetia bacterium]
MEVSAPYLDQLDAALEKRRQWLETDLVPRLREAISSYDQMFEGAVGMLIRKGLLREDPYNYEQSFTDITIPKDEILPEFENADELSYRLAAFRRQLKYASTEFPIDIPKLNLARLKKLSSLVTYINWLEMGESSKSPTTKAFARAFMKVRMGQDSMAAQILKDAETQIIKTIHVINGMLADLIVFCRESWKAEVRHQVLPAAAAAPAEGHSRRDEMVKAIRRGFANRMGGRPWYPTLAEEVVDEELAADGEERRARVLSALTIAAPVKDKPVEAAPDGKAILLEAVRLLCRPSEDLATAVAILEENERIIMESHTQKVSWLRRLLGSTPAKKPDEHVYKVEYTEPGTPTAKTETIDFPAFTADVQKKSSLLAALGTGTGPTYKRLASTADEQLAGFVDRQLNELLLIHRRLGSLNTYFQARVAQEKKTARGIKIELLTIKNALVKANQRRHDYKDKKPA